MSRAFIRFCLSWWLDDRKKIGTQETIPMQTNSLTPSAVGSYEDRPFTYHGCHFVCSASAAGGSLYQPHVLYQHGLSGLEQMALPIDTEPYGSAAEALRHAEQQAVRWVHDRTGDGQGRF